MIVLINAPRDMKWLRDVHLPRLSEIYKAAVIHGSEDYPYKIEVYKRRNPVVTDAPTVYLPDEDGVYHKA